VSGILALFAVSGVKSLQRGYPKKLQRAKELYAKKEMTVPDIFLDNPSITHEQIMPSCIFLSITRIY